MQNLLNKCPSERLGFFTTGDDTLYVYDCGKDTEIHKHNDSNNNRGEFSSGVEALDAGLGTISFPSNVHSVAG